MDILLVEDNESDAYLLQELLARNPEAPHLHHVTDGHEALAYMKREKPYENSTSPDLILLDLGLPRISGYEVLKTLKEKSDGTTIPVIILTTSRNPMDRNQCMALGADAFISKPHNLREYEMLAEHIACELPRMCNIA